MEHINIPVKVMRPADLYVAARKNIEKRKGEPTRGVLDARIIVNFIRHRLTPYDDMMNKAPGAQKEVVRRAVLEAIKKAYFANPLVVKEVNRLMAEAAPHIERHNRYATAEDIAAFRKGRAI